MTKKKETTKFRKLKSGAYRMSIPLDDKKKALVYKAAILDNKLTLADLAYQYVGNTKNFKDVVIAAATLQAIKEYLGREEENA